MTDNIVFVRIKGGLGNQMFQYAAGMALAHRTGSTLKLDLGYFPTDPLREFALDAFGIACPVATPGEIAEFKVESRWRRKLGKAVGCSSLFMPAGLYVEPHFQFDEDFFHRNPPVLLDGYWQSERYFGDYAGDIRTTFSAPPLAGDAAAVMREQIASTPNAVSVHVRLGDYLTGKAASKMAGSCTPDYYRRAVGLMDRALDQPVYFVFSDEPDRADRMLDFVKHKVIVDGDPSRPAEDIALMSACRHHVIANSSFSWWGAWLNPAADKIVVAPRLWFSRDYLRKTDTSDLYPQNWLTLG